MRFCALLLSVVVVFAGCHRNGDAPLTAQQKADLRAERESQREQMLEVPPPVKSKFIGVRSMESWENPYLTVQDGMMELHVTQPDPEITTLTAGGMFKPKGARQQVVILRPESLGEGMTAVPKTDWPYGRVVAIEEAHNVPAGSKLAVSRSVEQTIATLTDLGIVVFDPAEGTIR